MVKRLQEAHIYLHVVAYVPCRTSLVCIQNTRFKAANALAGQDVQATHFARLVGAYSLHYIKEGEPGD